MKTEYILSPELVDLSFDEFIVHDDDLPDNVIPFKKHAPVSMNENIQFFENCIDMGIWVKKIRLVK